jgi:hypothetical protein
MRDELPRDTRSEDLCSVRASPRHRRLAGGVARYSLSESESISLDHSMEGKAIESLTGCEASTSELKSKDPANERERFLKEIMGHSLLITGVVAAILRACSRAAVAGEHDLGAMIPWYMIVVVCGVKKVFAKTNYGELQ